MASRPVKDTLQQRFAALLVAPQSASEWQRFRLREVGELDARADVERRHPRVADQVRRGRDPEQAESEAAEVRLLGPPGVALPDGGEELVGGERQALHHVDLVDEDHQPGYWVLGVGCWVAGGCD